jgi:PilZ domain
VVTIDVRLESPEWIGAWKPEAGRLTVKAPSAPRLHDRVAVRVQLANPSVRATVVGTVVSSHRQNAHHQVELAVEAESLDAASMLLAAAQGEPVAFRERPPRYLVQLPVLMSMGGASFYVTTSSVSSRGCALRWPGLLPRLGEDVNLRFRGSRSIDVRGVVRWKKPATSLVGLRFVDAPADAWRAILEGVRKSGAPPG